MQHKAWSPSSIINLLGSRTTPAPLEITVNKSNSNDLQEWSQDPLFSLSLSLCWSLCETLFHVRINFLHVVKQINIWTLSHLPTWLSLYTYYVHLVWIQLDKNLLRKTTFRLLCLMPLLPGNLTKGIHPMWDCKSNGCCSRTKSERPHLNSLKEWRTAKVERYLPNPEMHILSSVHTH